MSDQYHNPLLSAVIRRIHRTRPLLSSQLNYCKRVEKANGAWFVELWFATSGCSWDCQGGCTMCNYGQGHKLSEDETVSAVHDGLETIDVEVGELLVSPSGSMLDPKEVPISLRRRIFSLIRDYPVSHFTIETCAHTVNTEVIEELVEALPEKNLGVEMGLESSNAWIQKFCVNKGSSPDQFTTAARILARYGVSVHANILLGTAFLSPLEAIIDTVNSVRWALANGAQTAIVFPVHVKQHTLLNWLYERGLYRPPSLWSLVEVLHQLGPELARRTNISWYRNYYSDMFAQIISPTTCDQCEGPILDLLDKYRDDMAYSVIEHLYSLDCECKRAWRDDLNNIARTPLPQRVLEIYKELADHFLSNDWWNLYGAPLQDTLLKSLGNSYEPEVSTLVSI